MWDVRQGLLKQIFFKWAYSSVTHFPIIFCEALVKHFYRVVTKEALQPGLWECCSSYTNPFASQCSTELMLRYCSASLLDLPSIWSLTCCYNKKMFLLYLTLAGIHDVKALKFDPHFVTSTSLSKILNTLSFWDRVGSATLVFDHVCKAIGVYKSNNTTMSQHMLAWSFSTSTSGKQNDWTRLIARISMYIPSGRQSNSSQISNSWPSAVTLCITQCPLQLRNNFGQDFLPFENSSIPIKCHRALIVLAETKDHRSQLLEEFMRYSTSSELIMDSLKD